MTTDEPDEQLDPASPEDEARIRALLVRRPRDRADAGRRGRPPRRRARGPRRRAGDGRPAAGRQRRPDHADPAAPGRGRARRGRGGRGARARFRRVLQTAARTTAARRRRRARTTPGLRARRQRRRRSRRRPGRRRSRPEDRRAARPAASTPRGRLLARATGPTSYAPRHLSRDLARIQDGWCSPRCRRAADYARGLVQSPPGLLLPARDAGPRRPRRRAVRRRPGLRPVPARRWATRRSSRCCSAAPATCCDRPRCRRTADPRS